MAELPDLRYSFHDSKLCEVAVGPRRELMLGLDLDTEEQQHKGSPRAARIRFGGIENYDEICAFFEQLQRQKVSPYETGRVQLDYARHLVSTRNRLVFQIDFEYYDSCIIHCRNVNVWEDDSMISHL